MEQTCEQLSSFPSDTSPTEHIVGIAVIRYRFSMRFPTFRRVTCNENWNHLILLQLHAISQSALRCCHRCTQHDCGFSQWKMCWRLIQWNISIGGVTFDRAYPILTTSATRILAVCFKFAGTPRTPRTVFRYWYDGGYETTHSCLGNILSWVRWSGSSLELKDLIVAFEMFLSVIELNENRW